MLDTIKMGDNCQRKKILCLVGTRPECIKMAPVILALKNSNWADPKVLSTGQHQELVTQMLSLFKIKIDYDLDVMQPNQSLSELSSNIFKTLDRFLVKNKFDLIIVQGDTTSVMVAALAAFYRKIPVAHVEAGLRTNDISNPFPEELNRRATSLVASMHFAPTTQARQNLLKENIDEACIHVTGNTVIDALYNISKQDNQCYYPTSSIRKLILVTSHRRENWGAPLVEICSAVHQLHDRNTNLEFVFPVHPNPKVHDIVHEQLRGLERVHLLEPVDYLELVSLMRNSYLVLTDSGGIQEEAPALGKPVLVLRDETERPEAVEAGVAKLVGPHENEIVNEVEHLLNDADTYAYMSRGETPYGDGNAAEYIVKICKAYFEKKNNFLGAN